METEIIILNEDQLNLNKLRDAVNHVLDGHVVAFPTDTIYGLGCDVFNSDAVDVLYTIKERPKDKPINVLISEVNQVYDVAQNIKPVFFELAERFWPGGLTIVVEKNSSVPDNVTSNLPSVGVRMPDSNIVQQMIKLAFTPIAATSANLSEQPDSKTAKTVLGYFEGKIPCIIDGGTTELGKPSTILDISGKTPKIIRSGVITGDELREIIPKLKGK
ncbi:MAG: threonylcarbamoyl-AMP synthase [Candidatus Heimdallarchaeota archaeon]|nr:threonylcarbamoyl-AMP synthase [Candidatus Heimdallarchaeota archaeon]